jgi:hypothetical protein
VFCVGCVRILLTAIFQGLGIHAVAGGSETGVTSAHVTVTAAPSSAATQRQYQLCSISARNSLSTCSFAFHAMRACSQCGTTFSHQSLVPAQLQWVELSCTALQQLHCHSRT